MQAIKLYTNPGSRGKIGEWVLAELQVPYEMVLLDMKKGEHRTPEYLAINPFGKVPSMEDGDLKLFESGAILLHLATKYGNLSADSLSKAYQWTLFANSTMSTAFFNNRNQMADMLGPLNSLLSSNEYLEGPEFSVSDIAVGAYLLYLPLFYPEMFVPGSFADKYPAVWQYMTRIMQRPSCPTAYREGMQRALQALSPAPPSGGGGPGSLFNVFKKR